jgi:uncharacterized Zn finger protein (UPF0148 family)
VTSNPGLVLAYFVFWAALVQALLVRAELLPPACGRCGLKLTRKHLGDAICSCDRNRHSSNA